MPNKKKLYEALKAEGYDNFADESAFNSYVDNPDHRKKLFNALKSEGYDNFTDEKSFNEYLGYSDDTLGDITQGNSKHDPFEENVERMKKGEPAQRISTQSMIDANPELGLGDEKQSFKVQDSEIKRLQGIKDKAQKQIDESGIFKRFFDADTRAAVAARNQAEEALETYEEAKHAEEGWFDRNVLGVFRGIGDKIGDLSTWDFGATGISSGYALKDVSDKLERGEQLSSSEQNMLDAFGLAAAVHTAYQDKVGMAYKAGQGLPESAAFMASLALNPAGGVGKKIAESAAKAAVKKYGTSMVSKLAKGAARVGGDALEMAVATAVPGAGRVAEDYFNRVNGQSTFDVDANGIIRYGGQVEQEEADDAIWKAFGSQFIENYSESVGNYFSPMGNVLSQLTSKGLKAAHLGKLADVVNDISSSQFSKGLQRFKEKTKFDGLVGEYLEEVAGNFMNAATVGDMNFNSPEDPNSVFNLDMNIQTALSCALMSGTMYAVEAPISIYNKGKVKRNLQDADKEAKKQWGDRWEDMRSQMDEADPELLTQLLSGISNATDLSDEAKQAAKLYATRLMQYQGYNARRMQNQMESTEETNEVNNAYDEGYDASTPYDKHSAKRAADRAEAALGDDVEFAKVVLEGSSTPVATINAMAESGKYTEEQIAKAKSYYTAINRMNGMTDALLDEVDSQIESANVEVDMNTNKDLNQVVKVVLRDGRAGYVINGTVTPGEKNTVDVNHSDSVIYVRLEDGEVKQMNPHKDLAGVAWIDSPENLKNENNVILREKLIDKGIQEIDWNPETPNPKVGDSFEMDGVPVTIVSHDGNGGMFVVPTEEWQAAIGNEKKQQELIAKAQQMGVVQAGVFKQWASDQLDAQEEADAVQEEQSVTPEVIEEVQPAEEGVVKENFTTETQQSVEEKRPMTEDEAAEFIFQMERNAVEAPEIELTPENWITEFGEDGLVETPIGQVKFGQNQYVKLQQMGRRGKLGMIRPTLTEPDVIIEDKRPSKDGSEERDFSYVFIKAFTGKDGKRMYYFTSVTIRKDGSEVVISNQEKSLNKISRLLQSGNVVWTNSLFSSHPTTQIEESVPLNDSNKPTSTDNQSAWLGINSSELYINKDSEKNVQSQEKKQKPFHEREKEEVFRELGDKYGEKMPRKVEVTAKALADDLAKAQKKLDKAIEEYDNAPIGREEKAEKARNKAQEEFDVIKRQADFWAALDSEIKDAQARRESILNPKAEVETSTEPMNVDEFVAQQLASGNIVLDKEDYKKETGYGDTEANAMNGGATKLFGKNGMTIQEAGERLMEIDRENGTNFFDQLDSNSGRDALINVLGSVKSRKELNQYIASNRSEQAKKESEGLRNELEKQVMGADYASLEDYVLQMEAAEMEENPFRDIDVAQIDAIFVEAEEEYQNYINNEQGRTSEVVEGDNNVLSEEQADNTGGTSGVESEGHSERNGEGASEASESTYAATEVELKQEEGETILQFAERAAEENRRRPLRKRAEEWSNTLGVKVTYLESIDEVDARTRAEIEAAHAEGKSVPGWVNKKGEVFFFMPDLSDLKDVDDTYIHEVVAHVGLPQLLGKERFGELCDKVWEMMPQSAKDYYMSYPGVKNHRDAADEYIAALSEEQNLTPEQQGIWDKIVQFFREALDNALNGIIGKSRITNADIANLIKASYANLKSKAGNIAIQIEKAREEVDQNPTEAQKEAGNYKKGHAKIDGYDITIENPKGGVRSGIDKNGKKWSITMNNDYGYIRNTEAVDGDHIDVFLSDNPNEGNVFVVDQSNEEGSFDESKVMYGFNSLEEARAAYLSNYEKGWESRIMAITEVSKEEFKKWIDSSHRKTKAFSEYKSVKIAPSIEETNVSRMSDIEERLAGIEGERIEIEDQLNELGNSNPIASADLISSLYKLDREQADLESEYSGLRAMNDESNAILEEEGSELRFKVYKSKDGKETKYKQLSLFGEGNEAIDDWTRPNNLQREGDSTIESLNRLRELQEGEICNVERKFTESKEFSFTRGEKIESAADVAYIFKSLEDEAIENSFVAVTNGDNVTVLHLGMGAQTQTVEDTTAIFAAVERLGADKIFFVHNHPTGNVKCSRQDVQTYQALKDTFGDKLQDGIIINTRSGKYGLFNSSGLVDDEGRIKEEKNEYPLKVYKFNKQSFNVDVIPTVEASSSGIAEFVSTQRLGKRDKVNALLLNNQFGCVGNILIDNSKNMSYVAERITNDAIAMGARQVVIYGRYPFVEVTDRKTNFASYLSSMINGFSQGNVNLIDIIQIDEPYSKSANDEGVRFRVKFTPEEQTIIKKAKTDGSYMKAPNGKPTNLNEKQWAQVRTEAFKKWFGDWENELANASKVVDENGEPMVVYHGSEENFNEFDKTRGRANMDIQGMFFSPWDDDARGYGSNVRAFYLNIRKPANESTGYKALKKFQGQNGAGIKAREYLASVGYDGVNNEDQEFIAFEANQIKSATDNVGTFDEGNNDIRFRFIGERGARNLDKAEEATTRLDNLNVAREMEAAEKDAKTIKMATGWERGADGLWRYEVDDNIDFELRRPKKTELKKAYEEANEKYYKLEMRVPTRTPKNATEEEKQRIKELRKELAKLRKGMNKAFDAYYDYSAESATLGEFLGKDNQLFKEYPELADYDVSFLRDSKKLAEGLKGSFTPEYKVIWVDDARPKGDIKSTLVHEIQHAIQGIEGFAQGGTPTSFASAKYQAEEWKANFNEFINRYGFEDWSKNLPIEDWMKYGKEYKGKFGGLHRAFIDNAVEDEDVKKTLTKELDYVKAAYDKFYQIAGGMDPAYKFKDANEWYRSLSGEVESRNVQQRMGMTDEQRRNSLASETEDVAREDQIFLKDGIESGMRFRLSEKGKQIQAEVDKFTSKYNSKPVRIVEAEMDDNELMEALDNAFELEDVKSFMAKSKTAAGYFHNLDKIIIFADRTKVERMEEYLFHENIHAAIHHDNFANLVAYFYEYAKDAAEFERWNKLAHNKEYKKYNASEEFLAYVVSNAMVARNLDDVANYLGDKQKDALNVLFNKLGYDYDIRRRSDEQSVNGRTGEGTPGESSLEGDELLNTGEGRGIGEGTGEGKGRKISPKERKARLNELFGKVADMGLDGVLGNKQYGKLLMDIYNIMPDGVRRQVNEWAITHYGSDFVPAMSDYLNKKASANIWDKVVGFVRESLRKVGFDLDLNSNDVKYMLWRSQNPMNRYMALDVAEDIDARRKFGVDGDSGVRFSVKNNTPFDPSDKRSKIVKEYDNFLKTGKFNFIEAFQDRMYSVKVLMDMIVDATGKKVRDFEDAYTAENHLGSINRPAEEEYLKNFYKPLVEAVKALSDKYGRDAIERYIYCKSGLERNEVLRQRDADEAYKDAKAELDEKLAKNQITKAQYDALLQQAEHQRDKTLAEDVDYSGIRGMLYNIKAQAVNKEFEEGKINKATRDARLNALEANRKAHVAEWKKFAEDQVSAVENAANPAELKDLWKKINAATNETLRMDYESGMIDKATYDAEKNMMKYYVPLRNWSDTTAEEMYEYRSELVRPVSSNQNRAKGRESQADNPIATIALMAQNAIVRGNRNKVKQKFYAFVSNRETGLASVRDVWYVKDPVDGNWMPMYADTSKAKDAEEFAQILDDFETDIKILEEAGMAFKGKLPFGMKFRANRQQKQSHVVPVMINGKEYAVYVNGNPRPAQAMNGETNSEASNASAWYDKIKRIYGAGLTSWNPDFIIPNMIRDGIHASTMTFLDAGPIAAAKFAFNGPRAFAQVFAMISGVKKHWVNPKNQAYFEEFITNGGETGYTAIHTLEDYKKEYDKLMKEVKGLKGNFMKNGIEAMAKWLEAANRIFEDVNRFNAYVSARESGESIQRSVNAAKNITVNFNRKGALSANNTTFGTIANFMSKWILFFNPAVQGIAQLVTKTKVNPKRAMAMGGTILASGFFMPMLNEMLVSAGGDDEEDDYWNQSDYKRRNNWLLFTGNGYLSVPLPPVLRELYGIGDIIYGSITGHITPERAAMDFARQAQSAVGFINLIPEVSQEPDLATWAKGFAPDIAAPVLDVISNTNFMGSPIAKWTDFNEYNPEYERVYKGVSPQWVELSKLLNKIGGQEGRRSDFWGNFINPAMMEHLVTSYGGGIGKTINNLVGMSVDIAIGNTENLDPFRKSPIAPRFYIPNDEKTVAPSINRKFYNYNYMYNVAKKALKNYQEGVKTKEHPEWQKYIDEMKANGELEFIRFFENENKRLKKIQNRIKEEPSNKKELEERMNDMKAKIASRCYEMLK